MGWIIFGCVLAVLAALLALDLTFTVRYAEEFTVSAGVGPVKYGLLVPEEEKQRRAARKEEKAARKKKSSGKKSAAPAKKKPSQPKKNPEKGNVKETVQTVWDLICSVAKPLPFLLRHFRVTGLELTLIVGGDNAAETALNYGKLCAVVHGSLAALKNLIRVRVKRIDISCDFCGGATRQQMAFKLKIRLGILLWALLRMGAGFLAHTYKRNKQPAGPQEPVQ